MWDNFWRMYYTFENTATLSDPYEWPSYFILRLSGPIIVNKLKMC